MEKVFISYSHKDKPTADAICNCFESNGLRCWYAPRDITPGTAWADAIINAIETCDLMVVVFTKESNISQQVMNEISNAVSAGLTIVPFILTDEKMTNFMRYHLNKLHWLDATDKELREAILELYDHCSGILKLSKGKAEAGAPAAQVADTPAAQTTGMTAAQSRKSPVAFNTMPGRKYIHAKDAGRPDLPYREGPVIIRNEEAFWVLITVMNTSPDEAAIAEGVRLSIAVSSVSERETRVTAAVICPDASPAVKEQSIDFVGEKPFGLSYIKGSAFLYSEYFGLHGERRIQLSDEIMEAGGALLGFWDVDGRIPGGAENTVTVSIKLSVN